MESIHNAVLSSSRVYNKDYLELVLRFLKLPLKQEIGWMKEEEKDMLEQCDLVLKISGEKKHLSKTLRLWSSMICTARDFGEQ